MQPTAAVLLFARRLESILSIELAQAVFSYAPRYTRDRPRSLLPSLLIRALPQLDPLSISEEHVP